MNALSYLGRPAQGVPAQCNGSYQMCRNGKGDCLSCGGNGHYGKQYQCVEYVRRFYAQSFNADLNAWPVMNASDFWSDDNIQAMGKNGEFFKKFQNGASFGPPRIGDIVVLRKPKGVDKVSGYGHVAIVQNVTPTKVTFIEQNWSTAGSVQLSLTESSDGTYRVADRTSTSTTGKKTTYTVMGWLRRYCGMDSSITEIGVGLRASPYGVNDQGQVTGGMSLNPNVASDYHAFVWDETGGVRDLGTLGDSSQPSIGLAINNVPPGSIGVVVGQAQDAARIPQPFVWDHQVSGVLKHLGTLGGNWGVARSINSKNHITGNSYTHNGDEHAFLWMPDSGMTDLQKLSPLNGIAFGINIRDEAVGLGYSRSIGGASHAMVWTISKELDIGAIGDDGTLATAVNDQTQVVGWGSDRSVPDSNLAFIWDAVHGMQPLSTDSVYASEAWGINNEGLVVGTARAKNVFVPPPFAFLWNPKKKNIINLNDHLPSDSGWYLRTALGISDTGFIVGEGIHNGQDRPFRMCVGSHPID